VKTVPCGLSTPGRGCGRPIVWARTRSGKQIPVDPDPVPWKDGGLTLIDGDDVGLREPIADIIGYTARKERDAAGVKLYRTHFATCPVVSQFRKRPDPGQKETP
jgi:hypothetical protein